jgi:phage terminase large subunit
VPEVELPNGWEPRPYQLPAWVAWERGIKRLLLVWHRRAGKDDVALHMAAVAAHERVANYWHMLPEYAQARKAIWESVNPHTGKLRIDQAFPKELRASTRNDEMAITFKNGSSWRVVGSDRPDSLVGSAPAGIVFSEFALSNPTTWALLAPILEENGGWAAFITTPRGRNHVHSMLAMAQKAPQTWFAEVLPATKTGIISAERIARQRDEYVGLYGDEAADALIDQEYFCSFEAAILGAYYGKLIRQLELDNRVTAVPYDPDLPVHRAWDLGIGDSTSIWWFQVAFGQLNVVDWHEANGVGMEHYAKVIRDKGYPAGDDWMPHDARVREFGSGRTRIETWMALGFKAPRIVPMHKVDDGINAVRQTLPRCRFDFDRCKSGLERLRQYKRVWDDDKKVFSDTPCHDWTSHTADAFRYLAMAWRELSPADRPVTMKEKLAELVRPPTLDEMLADADAEEW